MEANNHHRTLQQLANSITAMDIATPEADLVSWQQGSPVDQTVEMAREYNLTYVPVRDAAGTYHGLIEVAWLLENPDPAAITTVHNWRIDASTPVFDLLAEFKDHLEKVFLLTIDDAVVGLVAPADLNKVAARTAFYVLLAEFEMKLAELVRELPKDEDYWQCLDKDRFKKLEDERSQRAGDDMNLDLVHYMYITDLAKIARKHPRLCAILGKPSKSYMEAITQLRNGVDHPANVLSSRKKLKKLYQGYQNLRELETRMNGSIPAALSS